MEGIFPNAILSRQAFQGFGREEARPRVNVKGILRASLAGCSVADIDDRVEERKGEVEEKAKENGWCLEDVYGIHWL